MSVDQLEAQNVPTSTPGLAPERISNPSVIPSLISVESEAPRPVRRRLTDLNIQDRPTPSYLPVRSSMSPVVIQSSVAGSPCQPQIEREKTTQSVPFSA